MKTPDALTEDEPLDRLPDAFETRRVPVDSPIKSEAVEAMRAIRFRIPANVISVAVKEAIDRGIIDDDQAKALEWFGGYCRHKNLGREEMGSLLSKGASGSSGDGKFYSYDTLYQVLTGRRVEQGANIIPVVEAIQAFQTAVEPASRLESSGFVDTRMSRAIFDRLDRARQYRKIAFIFGDSQIGKSESIAEYTRRHNHGETIAIDMPDTPSLAQVKKRLGMSLALSGVSRPSDLGDAIASCFREGKLLIFDNFHRALRRAGNHRLYDFIQSLFDDRRIGVGIFMTNEGRDLLVRGPERKRLEQLWRRRTAPIQLPNVLPDDDLALFAKARGLPAAPAKKIGVSYDAVNDQGQPTTEQFIRSPLELQSAVVAGEGLGIWISILDLAVDLAARERKAPDWHYVLKAYCIDRAETTLWS
jgi:hypothetical protein